MHGFVINQFVVVELFCAGWTFHFGESARVALSLCRAMMIDYGLYKHALEQLRHLWVLSWTPPPVSLSRFDHVLILVALSLDGHF